MGCKEGVGYTFLGPMEWSLSQGDGLYYHWLGLVATLNYTRVRLDDRGRRAPSREDEPAGPRVAFPRHTSGRPWWPLEPKRFSGRGVEGTVKIETATREGSISVATSKVRPTLEVATEIDVTKAPFGLFRIPAVA